MPRWLRLDRTGNPFTGQCILASLPRLCLAQLYCTHCTHCTPRHTHTPPTRSPRFVALHPSTHTHPAPAQPNIACTAPPATPPRPAQGPPLILCLPSPAIAPAPRRTTSPRHG